MPTNVSVEYALAQKEFYEAKTTDEKLRALQKMLSTAPTHKGAEKLRADIKSRIAKLKAQIISEKKAGKGKSFAIKKEGAGQVVIVGLPNSGKSTLLQKLSGKPVEIAPYEFTTKEPVVRMIPFENIKVQGIEIPAVYDGFYDSKQGKMLFGLIRNADVVLVTLRNWQELKIIEKEFQKAEIILGAPKKEYKDLMTYLPSLNILQSDFDDAELPRKIWEKLGKIRVQTKSRGRIAEKPIILPANSTIGDVAKTIHKDFIRKFKYAKIWGPSAHFAGEQVGLEHAVKDTDVIEIFLK